MTSASPSEDDDPEDPESPSGRKKKRKRKTKRPEGRRSQEAKAITTSKIVVNLPEFTGKDLSEFAENSPRILWGPKIPKPATVRNTTFFVKLYHKEHNFPELAPPPPPSNLEILQPLE